MLRYRAGGGNALDRSARPNVQRGTREAVELGFRSHEMERAMHVRVTGSRRERERRRGGFELVERTERRLTGCGRAVVVAVDDVPVERFFLYFPHGVHVAGGVLGTRILHERQHMRSGIVAAGNRARTAGGRPILLRYWPSARKSTTIP